MEESKFNFSEDPAQEQPKDTVAPDAKGLLSGLKRFMIDLLDFRQDTDRDATIDAIKADVPFKGATAWILVCSIFVASVGLNANSTAVVIGAMLISPLMGPILGVGMSIAINDIDVLRKSLINLSTMIVLSLITAFLFFWLFPLSEETSELFARTRPDIRDVLIAFFGGLALIIARTKRGTIASVIFGVAIATALMPPLCTAGYGLATQNWEFFFGAMYLFTINTIFIALATFIVLKVLRFPMIRYANSRKRKRIARIASLLAIVVMVPAVWTFINVLNESNFYRDANNFINNELEALPHAEYLKKNAIFKFKNDEPSVIEINTFGLDEIPESSISILKARMNDYRALTEATLIVNQNRSANIDNIRYMEELRSRDSLDLLTQSQKIQFLEEKVTQLSRLERNYIAFEELSREVKINYDAIEKLSYSNVITSDFAKIDTVSVFTVKWYDSLATRSNNEADIKKLKDWFKTRLKLDTLIVRSQN